MTDYNSKITKKFYSLFDFYPGYFDFLPNNTRTIFYQIRIDAFKIVFNRFLYKYILFELLNINSLNKKLQSPIFIIQNNELFLLKKKKLHKKLNYYSLMFGRFEIHSHNLNKLINLFPEIQHINKKILDYCNIKHLFRNFIKYIIKININKDENINIPDNKYILCKLYFTRTQTLLSNLYSSNIPTSFYFIFENDIVNFLIENNLYINNYLNQILK